MCLLIISLYIGKPFGNNYYLLIIITQRAKKRNTNVMESSGPILPDDGATPLHVAAAEGNLEEVKKLLRSGVFVYSTTRKTRNNALMIALANKHEAIASEILDQYEADTKPLLNGDWPIDNSIYVACTDDQIHWVLQWSQEANDGNRDRHIYVLLYNDTRSFVRAECTKRDQLKVLNELANNGMIDVNLVNRNGQSALHMAAENGYLDIVKRLLLLGADHLIKHSRQDKYGDPYDLGEYLPIHYAVHNGHRDVFKELVKQKDFDILTLTTIAGNKNTSILHLAANCGDVDLFNDILDKMVEAKFAKTSLEKTEQYRHLVVTKFLEQLLSENCLFGLRPKTITNDVTIEILKYFKDMGSGDFSPVLIKAIANDNLEAVKAMVARKIDILDTINNHYFGLLTCAHDGKLEMLKEIVTLCPPEMFKHNSSKATASLRSATLNNHKEVVKYFLELGVDIDAVGENGETTLLSATWGGHMDMVKLILEIGKRDAEGKYIHLNTANKNMDTPIDHTVRLHANEDIFDLLLSEGANLNVVNSYGWSPIHFATRFGHHTIVHKMIKHGVDLKVKSDKGDTPIHSAIKSGSYETFKLLFNEDVDMEERNNSGNTLLILAAKFAGKDILDDLLKAGADVHAKNETGNTALHFATNFDVIQELIALGLDPMTQNNEGYPPFLEASCNWDWRTEQCKNHLKLDLDYTYTAPDGTTLLHYFCSDCKSFIKHFREILTEDKYIPLFEKCTLADCNKRTPLLLATKYNSNIKVIQKLLKHGKYNLNETDSEGNSALNNLISSKYNEDNADIIDLLLSQGADIDIVNKHSLTPLMVAAQHGLDAEVRLLVQHGADVNKRCGNGQMNSVLHYAAEGGSEAVMRHLVAAGADLKVKNCDGKTPFELWKGKDIRRLFAYITD